ncbi:ead/Ea22-like family protein [Escherichia coli]
MSELYYPLRERYSPKAAPKCSVCGEEMSMQRISGSHVVYACSGMEDDGCFKTGRTYADEHYKKSRITVVDDSDPDVIELLDENMEMALTLEKLRVELEEAKSKLNEQREYYEGVISDGSKRIAELEAREIKPAKGEVLVVVSGFTGCGKSAIAGEIEIAMKAIGVPVKWTNGDAEKRMTGADWLTAIEMYKPTVRIVEVNVPRAAGIGVKGE